MRENARQGYFNGSRAPYGFRVERVEIRPGVRRGKLVPNPDEVPTLREVFRLCVEHRGAKAVARALNQRGQRYRNGKPWSKDLVLRALREEAAVGTFRWGRRTTKRGVKADPEDWIAIPVEPVVDRDLFDLAQELLHDRRPSCREGRTPSSPLLLAGLVRCGRCGASFQLETSGKRSAGGEYPYRYYNCRNTLRTGKERCEGYRVATERLEGAVLASLATTLFSTERCRALLAEVVAQSREAERETDRTRRALQDERADIEQRIGRWYEAFERGTMPADDGMERVRALRARRDEIDATLAKVVPLRPLPEPLLRESTLARFEASLRELFVAGNALTRHYLRRLVADVIVTDGEVVIRGKREAVLAMLASGGGAPAALLSAAGGVLATDVSWLRL